MENNLDNLSFSKTKMKYLDEVGKDDGSKVYKIEDNRIGLNQKIYISHKELKILLGYWSFHHCFIAGFIKVADDDGNSLIKHSNLTIFSWRLMLWVSWSAHKIIILPYSKT